MPTTPQYRQSLISPSRVSENSGAIVSGASNFAGSLLRVSDSMKADIDRKLATQDALQKRNKRLSTVYGAEANADAAFNQIVKSPGFGDMPIDIVHEKWNESANKIQTDAVSLFENPDEAESIRIETGRSLQLKQAALLQAHSNAVANKTGYIVDENISLQSNIVFDAPDSLMGGIGKIRDMISEYRDIIGDEKSAEILQDGTASLIDAALRGRVDVGDFNGARSLLNDGIYDETDGITYGIDTIVDAETRDEWLDKIDKIELAQLEREERESEKIAKERRAASYAHFVRDIDSTSVIDIDDALNRRIISGNDAAKLYKSLGQERAVRDDPETVVRLHQGVASGMDSDVFVRSVQSEYLDGNITLATMNSIISGMEKETDEEKNARKFVINGIITTGPFAVLDADKSYRRSSAIREFNQRLEAGKERPYDIADDIVERYRLSDLSAGAFPKPRFLNGGKGDVVALRNAARATIDAYNNGQITNDQLRTEAENIERLIEIAEGQ